MSRIRYQERLPSLLFYLNELVENLNNDGTHESVMAAIFVFNFLDLHQDLFPNVFNGYWKLVDVYQHVKTRPSIAAYLLSNKRPQYTNHALEQACQFHCEQHPLSGL
jgi:hypothetical protein